jgi:uncharacterized membrane protein
MVASLGCDVAERSVLGTLLFSLYIVEVTNMINGHAFGLTFTRTTICISVYLQQQLRDWMRLIVSSPAQLMLNAGCELAVYEHR